MVDLTYKQPKTLQEMATYQYAPLWQAAVDAELAKFDELEAYEVVDRADVPKETPVLMEGVVLRVKRDEHGQPNRFKARWVVKGCGQTWGTYDGTYAPVSQGPTSRMFVAGTSATKQKVVQLDISNAFLYAPIDRDIYVRPPEPRRDGDKVWKLKRSVYGLKQAPRLWHQHLWGVLLELDMVQSESDPSLFIWEREGNNNVWLLTYVDAILIQSHDDGGIEAVIQHLKQHFTLTISKTMTQFLGLNVAADNGSISLGLTKYISQALATFGMESSRSGVRTPITKEPGPQGEPPYKIDGQLVLKQVGTLLYISTAGRPDITYAAHVLASQASKPTATTVLGIHRVFNYLQNTADIGLVYGGEDLVLRGYTDSDHANEIGRHSIGGYVFTLGGAAVSWRTKRQTVIATSTAEA
ncbi:unnamed protein product [Closterium sp. NIES-53]